MARNRKKVSLYEVISKSSPKSSYGKTLKERPPEESDSDEPTTAQTAMPASGRAAYWPRKPKIIQLNAGRLEISLPYQLAIALLLGLVLLVLIGVWLGQTGYLSKQRITGSVAKILKTGPNAETDIGNRANIDEKKPPGVRETTTGESKGNNRIVIQTYRARADLEQVQTYFGQCGIETEIREIGGTFYLVTRNKYDNPGRQGTDGAIAKQEIIKFGAQYKAPEGYETFAPNLFRDAYGMKFDD